MHSNGLRTPFKKIKKSFNYGYITAGIGFSLNKHAFDIEYL